MNYLMSVVRTASKRSGLIVSSTRAPVFLVSLNEFDVLV